MPKSEQAFPVQYLRHIADQVRSLGVDVEPWLARHGLRESKLDDASLTISFDVFRELLLDAMRVTREPAFGLFVGKRLQANVHGMLGYAALSSGSIRQALELIEKFVQVRFPLVTIAIESRSDGVRVRVRESRPLGDIRRPVLEAVVMAMKNVLDTISTGNCGIGGVDFAVDAPDYTSLACELLGCEVRYGQPSSGLKLSADVLDAPLRMADPAAFRDAAAILQKEVDRIGASELLSDRVRRLLLEHQTGFPSLHVIARVLHMTPRTLHRRLVEEGTSFRELLEDVRHSLAREYLRSERFTFEEIAFTLGYTDLANFRRAFKRWESVPPSEYRERVSAHSRSRVFSRRRGES